MPPDSLPALALRRGEDRRIRAGHPWVFSNEVDTGVTPMSGIEPGAIVRVLDQRGAFLGYAYANPSTLIAARILSRDASQPVGPALLAQRLRRALALRERLHPTPHYRWVFGESDGLPGLVLDRYGDVVVAQASTLGMDRLRPVVEQAIREVVDPPTLVWKNDAGSRALEGLPAVVETAWGGLPDELEVVESWPDGRKLRCVAALADGQKTGWFYDQAFNRSLLGRFLPRGARVLDVCSYVGGWSVAAAVAGAAAVTCVDASAAALAFAARNVGAHGLQAGLRRGDAFDVLAAMADAGERYDVVIVDPPAFVKRRKELPQGVAAYRKLNQLALRLTNPEAMLVSCSCSYHLAADDLLGGIQAAARHVGADVQVLHAGGQSPDHPLHPAVPETRYLKAFFCRVSRG